MNAASGNSDVSASISRPFARSSMRCWYRFGGCHGKDGPAAVISLGLRASSKIPMARSFGVRRGNGVDQRSFKTAFGQLYFRAPPSYRAPPAPSCEVSQPRRARGSLRCAGRNRFRARPCPQGSSNPSLGSDRWRVRLLEPQLLAPAGLPRPRISLHVRCVSKLIRLPPPFHSQFSGSRARIRSPSQNQRHRAPWRTMLPRRSRRVVVAPARPASPQPRAPIGNREGDSRQRVGRWPVHPKRAGAPRSSPARPR